MKVTLLKPHTHASKKHPAGREIEVGKHHIDWLVGQGVIDKPEEGAAPLVPTAPGPSQPTKAATKTPAPAADQENMK